jgi:hypothetical protein
MASKRLRKSKVIDDAKEEVVHDRRSSDLLENAQVRAVTVDDPYERGGKIVAFQSIAGDTLANMHARGQVDDAQYEAGRKMREFYELATIGGARGIDPMREKVDGGQLAEPLTEKVQRAIQEVKRLEGVLGYEGTSIARDILWHGLTIQQCAQARCLFTRGGAEYAGKRFREVLETLAVNLNLVGRVTPGVMRQI